MNILKILKLMNLFPKNPFQYWVLINHLLIKNVYVVLLGLLEWNELIVTHLQNIFLDPICKKDIL